MRPCLNNNRSRKHDDGSATNRDITIARRLTTIVVSDFLCWFPIGVIGLLAATTNTTIPAEVCGDGGDDQEEEDGGGGGGGVMMMMMMMMMMMRRRRRRRWRRSNRI
jgi:hypothetical protein